MRIQQQMCTYYLLKTSRQKKFLVIYSLTVISKIKNKKKKIMASKLSHVVFFH